jgi:hypothetical protein
LTKEDLFHIPFNKRYLIQNQRYSVTGQPLLYLGLSTLDVVSELRENIDKIDEIYFCSLVHKKEKTLKVFDLTNSFPDFFANCEIFVSGGMAVPDEYPELTRELYRFVLAQVCSFRRSRISETGVFSEEYVIPQLLTGVLREHSFSGIIFSSTRVDTARIVSKAPFHVNRYRENVALFTNYDEERNYDHNLFDQFLISKIITKDDVMDFTLEDLSLLTRQVGKILNGEDVYNPYLITMSEITGISTRTLFENLFIKTDGEEVNYFEHPIGKMHLTLIYQMVCDFRNTLKNWV